MIKKRLGAMLLAMTLSMGTMSTTAFAYVNGDANASDKTEVSTEAATENNAESDTQKDTKKQAEELVNGVIQKKTSDTSDEENTLEISFEDILAALSTVESADKQMGKVTVSEGSTLNVRSGAGMNYDVIDNLKCGDEVEVQGLDGDWYKITIPSKDGYVHKDYLSVSTSEGELSLDVEMLKALYEAFMKSLSGSEMPALTPDGNLNLVDDIGSEKSGKQFITVATKSGNYFYILIDRDDEGNQTVHFLNLVDEADLLSLMDEDQVADYQAAVEAGKQETPEEPTVGVQEENPTPEPVEEPEKKSQTNVLPFLVLLIALAGAGGGFFYMQTKKKKEAAEQPDPDADYMDDDEEEDYGYVGEDDSDVEIYDEDEFEDMSEDNEPV